MIRISQLKEIYCWTNDRIKRNKEIFKKKWFTPCKAEQQLRDMELQEKDKKIKSYRKSA